VRLLRMSTTAWSQMEAQRAFTRAARARRRASLICRLRRGNGGCGGLAVYDERALRRRGPGVGRGVREIPLEAIGGTLEPNRAAQFDWGFRPSTRARARWERVWLAEHRGAVLPPISVVQVDRGYAIRDGHHPVSVAKARGAVSINAIVDAG
jgi:hypothetical protein